MTLKLPFGADCKHAVLDGTLTALRKDGVC